MPDEPRREADAVIEVTKEAAPIQIERPRRGELIAYRLDQAVELDDLERFADEPHRARGTYDVRTVESFIAYGEAHATEGWTTVWVHPSTGRVTAVFDDHGPEGAGWGQHRLTLVLENTPAWTRWISHDRQLMTQEAFAEHVEESIPDIAGPPASDLLEMAQSISMTTTATFRAAKRLHDGRTQLNYNEDVESSAGTSGQMEIPKELKLMLAPFIGEETVPVTARLRTRLNREKLTIGYILDRPEELVRETIDAIAVKLRAEFARVYIGTAPDARR